MIKKIFGKLKKVTVFRDENGNEWWKGKYGMVYSKNSDGREQWVEYNKQRCVTHFRNSSGDEWWKKYDKKRRIIYVKNCALKDRYGYDKDGNQFFISSVAYDEFGRVIYKLDKHGNYTATQYDKDGKIETVKRGKNVE